MAICNFLDVKRGNLCKHVVNEYMYIRGTSIIFHLVSHSSTLVPDFVEPMTIFPP
jgi:hypothetical protein